MAIGVLKSPIEVTKYSYIEKQRNLDKTKLNIHVILTFNLKCTTALKLMLLVPSGTC